MGLHNSDCGCDHAARGKAGTRHSALDLIGTEGFPARRRERRRAFTHTNLDRFNTVNVIQTFLERSRSEHSGHAVDTDDDTLYLTKRGRR
jgi:hypothetical protein